MIGAVLTTTLAYAPGVLRVQNAQPARATTLTMGVESELGATPPLGYWDPLGLVRDWLRWYGPNEEMQAVLDAAWSEWTGRPVRLCVPSVPSKGPFWGGI